MPALLALPVAVHSAAQPVHHQLRGPQSHAETPTSHRANAAKKPVRRMATTRVRAGDTVYGIARRMHSSVAAIVKANPGIEVRRLLPGTTLHVPVATSAAHTPSPHPATKPTRPATKPTRPATKPAATPHPGPSTHAPKPKHVVRYAGTAAARGYPASLVASGDRHRRQLAAADLPGQAQIRAMITSTAKRYGVSPKLALAIGWQESGHRQSAVSVCDALGTMQVMPTTGQWAGSIVHRHLDLLDTQDNITAGVVTLRFLTEHAHDQNEAIAAYYQGLGAVRAHGMYPDTRRYVASVNTHMKRFS
ncbi:transglycosylase SLT domain-containing protein [Dermacoccus sp. GAS27A]